MRRSLIAAAAVSGALAVASSASAIQMPMGTPSSTYSESGAPTSIYGLYNQASYGLIQAQNLIVGANALAAAPFNYGSAVDASFTTKFTAPSNLTSANVKEIASDIAASGNASQLEMAVCVFDVYPTKTSDTDVSHAFLACGGGGSPYSDSPYLAAAVAAFAPATTSGTIQNGVASAAGGWPDLSQLVGFLGSASGTLNSVDSATISSAGTVVSTSAPIDYSITLSAPTGGYVLPSAFSLTFPGGLSINTGLVSDEVNAAVNGTSASAIAAVEANPGSSAVPIGTVTLTSPLANEFGGSNNQFVGKIYAVQTGASSGQGSVTQPYLELWYSQGIYQLGSFPSSLAFPLTLNFGEVQVAGLGSEPLPINSLALSFPAATSPVKTSSCTTLGTVGGTAVDSVAGLAYQFGDATDGVSSASGTPAAVTLAATPTAVTNQCTATVVKKTKKVKNTVRGSAGGLKSGHPTLTLHIKTKKAFKSVTVALPKGMHFVKSKKVAKEVSASGTKIKSAKIKRGKLVIALKKAVKSSTVKTKRGLITETAALVKSIKKHKTKKLTVRVKAGSATIKASIKA